MPDLHRRRWRVATSVAAQYRVAGHGPDDLRQTAYLALLCCAPYDPRVHHAADEESYMRVIARRRLSGLVREASRRPRLDGGGHAAESAADDAPPPAALAAEREVPHAALAVLTPQQRAVVIRTFWGGWGDESIALAMRVSVVAVRTHRSEALERLRESGYTIPWEG